MKKTLVWLFVLVLLFSFVGCNKAPKYSLGYGSSEEAISILKDAIETLDMCIEGKITEEECLRDLEIISERKVDPDDFFADLATLSVSSVAGSIRNVILGIRLESKTNAELAREVKKQRDELYDNLYD